MDLAKTLIRSVARAFYETKHVLVIDALMVHSALPNEDLALLLGMQQKDLRKLCGKLKEDRLLAVHSRQETREGQQRPVNKDYYYIHFHATIDAIKYRIFYLTERVKDLYKPNEEKKDYHCPRCLSQYTTLQVLDNVGPTGFICHRCSGPLQEQNRTAGESSGHEKQSKLMSQLEPLLKLLKEIDVNDIPNNDFESAFSVAVPVQRNEFINPTRATEPIQSRPPTAVKGISENKIAPLEISVTTTSERTLADQAAEAQRKADLAAQNMLPVWHTSSTVTGENTAVIKDNERRSSNGGPANLLKREEEEKEVNVLTDELAAYYAQMQQEKEKEASEDRESDESSGDDDDDDFEDVGIGAVVDTSPSTPMTNGIKTAVSTSIATTTKKRGSESGSSAPGTNISTPVSGGARLAPDDGEDNSPAAKRVKITDLVKEDGNKLGMTDGNKAAVVEKDSDEDDGEDSSPAVKRVKILEIQGEGDKPCKADGNNGTALEKDSDEDEEAEFEDAL